MSKKRARVARTTSMRKSTYDLAVHVDQDADGVLRRRSEPVTDIESVKALAMRLQGMVARDSISVGLSAPQIRENVRVIAIRLKYPGGIPVVIVNPEVKPDPLGGDESDYEGCFSLPDSKVRVRRHSIVLLTGTNMAGTPISMRLTGIIARAAQHEIDHLDGVLISDHGKVESVGG